MRTPDETGCRTDVGMNPPIQESAAGGRRAQQYAPADRSHDGKDVKG